jgi:hypothetical protein
MIARDWSCALPLSRIDPERSWSEEHPGHWVMERHVPIGLDNHEV